jgi:MFS superfamily sulfate permease-like transporter
MKTREMVLSGAVVIGILTALFLLMNHLAKMATEIEEMKEYQRSSVPADVLDAYLTGGDGDDGASESETEEGPRKRANAPSRKNPSSGSEKQNKTKRKKKRPLSAPRRASKFGATKPGATARTTQSSGNLGSRKTVKETPL